ncbi:WD40-repeat-containing domain protein [Lasiosphaeris hirsuta]|uniref:WD40-repeat-containing domain protein n=1 Tax=Lasiosphaeris hirsuta TaxID=260670 RepID=A0AA39ZXB2_9PEZI|nr:WD40-repeat-containing domain protein [Lasiosphaeris hirsuta]
MQSSDPGHFFETDAEQATRQRRANKAGNKYGSPIQLKSKILAAVADPRAPSSAVLVAESAGSVRRVILDSEGQTTSYRGPTAPVSCLAIGGGPGGAPTVFAGSWDKAVWSWDLATRVPGRKFAGHADFVKAVVCARVSGRDLLISGGADRKIIVWDAATGACLHTLTDPVVNMMSVQDLVVDREGSGEGEVVVISASSDPHIRRWRVRLDGWEQVVEEVPNVPGTERRTILEHETTVYKLVLDQDGDEVDLWTSSGDGTTKCLSRLKGFACEDTFQHGDHVRAVAVTDQWVITAGRDEDLKFWERTEGRLYCSLVGHFDEVTDLVVLSGANGLKERVCSVSIDGTVRTWPLNKTLLDALVKEQTAEPTEEDELAKKEDDGDGLLTVDEQAELDALMEDSD